MKNSFDAPKIARKMLTWEALVVLVFIAPIAIFAAGTIGKSSSTFIPTLKGAQQIILTANAGSGNQTWTIPSDWNSSNNSIECIGAGGDGANIGAGGGGAYSKITNLSLTAGGTATYSIGAHASTTGSSSTSALQETYFNSTASSTASVFCQYGQPAITTSGGAGGTTAKSIGTTKNAGGAGGNGGAGGASGGGGGGAAGPTGAGGDGCNGGGGGTGTGAGGGGANGGASCNFSSDGANGNGGTGGGLAGNPAASGTAGTGGGGGGGSFPSCGGAGAIDTAFDATHGAGGGGGGNSGSVSTCGGNGGTYGGGAGGGTSATLGLGGQGIIVITYTPNPNPLVAWWTFDGADMTSNVADKSGSGNAGRLIGFTSTTTTAGPVGSALSFNGSTNYVSAPSVGVSSIAFWVKATSTTSYIVDFDGGTHYVWINAGTVTATGFSSPTIYVNGVVSSTISANVWSHIVVTTATGFTGSAITIGKRSTDFFGGSLDDVRIYNKALLVDEIKRLYGLGATTHIDVSPKTGLAATTSASGASNGLVGWWTFDGPDLLQNATDKSGNGNTGRLISFTSTTTVPGPLGQALSFDGVNDLVHTGKLLSSFISNTTGTISMWLKPTGSPATSASTYALPAAFSQNVSNNDGGYVNVARGIIGGEDYIWLGNYTGNGSLTGEERVGIPYTVDQWIHVVWVHSLGVLYGYKNGVLATSTASGNTAVMTTPVVLGENYLGLAFWKGSIDDVRVYSRALSADEVKKIYGVGATTHVAVSPTTGLAAPLVPSGASNGLVGWWTFDGPDLLQNAVDKSGNGNKGLLANFTSTTTVPGKSGQALTFDGVDDGINVVSIPELNPHSISVWFKLNALPGASEWDITSKVADVRNFGVLNDKLVVWDGTTGKAGATTLTAGVWYHAVLVHTGAQMTLYLNGTADGSATASTPAQDGPGGFAIGHQANAGRNFNGVLDDLRVYTRALSASEVQRLYDLGR